jgi:hypothetical protein
VSRRPYVASPRLYIGVTAGFWLFAVFMFYMGFDAYRLENATERTKSGAVTSSDADSTITYAPVVTVAHVAGGARYVAECEVSRIR